MGGGVEHGLIAIASGHPRAGCSGRPPPVIRECDGCIRVASFMMVQRVARWLLGVRSRREEVGGGANQVTPKNGLFKILSRKFQLCWQPTGSKGRKLLCKGRELLFKGRILQCKGRKLI